MLEVLSTGTPNTVQDLGRDGVMGLGVSRSGSMDRYAHTLANCLLGNPEDAATIEVALFPFRVRFTEATRFACTGADCDVRLDGRLLPTWWVASAKPGQTLAIEAPRVGARAYLAVRHGIQAEQLFGSRSTDQKTGFGGHAGRGLKRGDQLAIQVGHQGQALETGVGIVPQAMADLRSQLQQGLVSIRILAGAEMPRFTDESIKTLVDSEYEITHDANRMGYRLAGPALSLRSKVELLSHGIVPGTIQVPPSGLPIIQLAEANTCGGYPKLAHVISADLWKLAQCRPGCHLRFALVDHAAAVAALRQQRDERNRLASELPSILHRG